MTNATLPLRTDDPILPGDVGEVEPRFGRHETFHPRYGWLKKAYDAASADNEIFRRKDATVVLGLGKNMVNAIRYWSAAFKVLEEYPNPQHPRRKNVKPSAFGEQLLDNQGWDPFLEHPGSLWLLHWQLLKPPSQAPSWYAAFNAVQAVQFTDNELFRELVAFRDVHAAFQRVADGSLKKDADCLLRMYAAGSHRSRQYEDAIDSPFADLGLIRTTAGDRQHYRFDLGAKSTLPAAIVIFASLDFTAHIRSHAQTISLRRLVTAGGGPGRVFKLTEGSLRFYLEEYQAQRPGGVRLVETAGVPQLSFDGDAERVASEVLAAFYEDVERGLQ